MIDMMELYVKYELGIDYVCNYIQFIKDVHQAYRVYYDAEIATPETCKCGGILRYEGYEYHDPVYHAFMVYAFMVCDKCSCGYEF